MNPKPQTSPSDALHALQIWLGDGSLAAAVSEHELGNELQEVLVLLRNGKADLARVKALGQAADLISDVPWESVRDQVNRLATAAQALKEARTPDDLYNWRRAKWDSVKDATGSLERALKGAWRVRCEQPFGEHERLGAALSHLPETKALGAEMMQTAREGRQIGEFFPPSPEQRGKLSEFIDRAAKERQQLKRRGASETVSGLLVAAAENRATLADLTPDALEWLRRNSALTLFEIKLARAPAR